MGRTAALVGASALTMMGLSISHAVADAGDACTTGLTYASQLAEAGASAGPPIAYSAAISAVGIAVPAGDSPAAPVAQPGYQAFVEVAGTATQVASTTGVAAARQGADVAATLSAASPSSDALVAAGADALIAGADTLEPVIQPADRPMRQSGDALRGAACP